MNLKHSRRCWIRLWRKFVFPVQKLCVRIRLLIFNRDRMKHEALRIVIPEPVEFIDCLHSCIGFDPENPEKIDMVTLTVRGVSGDCLDRVKAALSKLILPGVGQVLPNGFAPRKGVSLSMRGENAMFSSASVNFSLSSKDPLRNLASSVVGKVQRVFAERPSMKTADITISFQ